MFQKLCQRFTDPVFYRKRFFDLIRPIRKLRNVDSGPPPSFSLEDLQAGSKVLLIVAHPDDELFCSGLLCRMAERGAQIEAVCLTRGEGGPAGGRSREELGAVREAEMRVSCELLGISGVRFLDHIDPVGKEFRIYAPDVSTVELASQIHGILAEAVPDVVITHGSGGEYWHPAHLLVHRAVKKALKDSADSSTGYDRGPDPVESDRRRTVLLTMNAWQPGHPLPGILNQDDRADLIIDSTADREVRLRALESHDSQVGFFAGKADGTPGGFVDATAEEGYHCSAAAAVFPEGSSSGAAGS